MTYWLIRTTPLGLVLVNPNGQWREYDETSVAWQILNMSLEIGKTTISGVTGEFLFREYNDHILEG
jgi:hypothetical protein